MKKLADEHVQKEKEEGKKRLEDALVKAREEFMTDKAEAVQKARDKERVIATEEAKKKTQVQKEKRKRQSYAAKKQKQVTEVGKCRVFPDCIAWRNKVFQRYDSVNGPPHIFTAPPFFHCQHLKLFRKV